jgi:hypothetical protein
MMTLASKVRAWEHVPGVARRRSVKFDANEPGYVLVTVRMLRRVDRDMNEQIFTSTEDWWFISVVTCKVKDRRRMPQFCPGRFYTRWSMWRTRESITFTLVIILYVST